MFTVKVIRETDERKTQEVFECGHYKKELNSSGDKEDFTHYLKLYDLESQESNVKINLHDMVEDKYGKYEQTIYIMNNNGKTIDRY